MSSSDNGESCGALSCCLSEREFFPIVSSVNAPLRVLTSLTDPLNEPSIVEGPSEDLHICCRAVSDQTSQAHTRGDRTDCQTHRLGLNLPTDKLVAVFVPLLLQSYREKCPADPVTEQEFGKLINELHPKTSHLEVQFAPKTTKTNAHGKSQGRPVTQQVTPMNNNDEHETMDERDGNLGPHTTSIFAEFLNGWRNLRPNGAMSNDAAERRPQRKLDVLSWGFGE